VPRKHPPHHYTINTCQQLSCQLSGVISNSSKKNPKTECNLCNVSASKGGSIIGSFNTTNLFKHLQKHHGKEYAEFIQTTSAKKKSMSQQPTLHETILKLEKLPSDSTKAKLIMEKETEFIVLNDQPFSIV